MKYFVIIIALVISMLCMGCLETEPPKTYSVYSMDFGGNEISGSFILGTGSIDTDSYYYYYLQDMEGRYRLKKALIDNSGIIMDKNITKQNAYIVIYDCACNKDCPTICEHLYGYAYEFHVPMGTITREFNGNVRSRSSSDDSDSATVG